jgi:DNA-binding XRE family transcriptional regulator
MTDKASQFNRAAGERLRQCRLFLKLTQEEFANDLGVSRTVLENWESGDNCPRPIAVDRARTKHSITHDWVYAGNAYLLPDDMKKAVMRPSVVASGSPAPSSPPADKAKRKKAG